MTSIRIVSCGTGHQDAPPWAADVIVDTTGLRNPSDGLAVRARLTQLTGLDQEVARYVMATPGARDLVRRHRHRIVFLAEIGTARVEVLVYCYGGRHRSVAITEQLAADLRAIGHDVQVVHWHLDRPVLPSRT